jgi:cation diffusion facilitator CzcD-associated flavoprotein CzcO
VNYQYSWRPTAWSQYYRGSREIWNYLKQVEQENRFIEKYVKVGHEIVGAEWDGTAGQWIVKVRDIEGERV